MEYVRKIDFDQLAQAEGRIVQRLLQKSLGEGQSDVSIIKTPPGDGSSAGLHSHVLDQIFYVISGTMNLEIDGQESVAGAGSVIFFPAGIKHRNWNTGNVPSMHLSFQIKSAGVAA